MIQIGEKLKTARLQSNLSQSEIGDQSRITKIENGKIDIKLSTLAELARKLNKTLTINLD